MKLKSYSKTQRISSKKRTPKISAGGRYQFRTELSKSAESGSTVLCGKRVGIAKGAGLAIEALPLLNSCMIHAEKGLHKASAL